MAAKSSTMTNRGVLEYLLENIPALETIGIRNFRQLATFFEDREFSFHLPDVDPVPPPKQPVRVIHNGHSVKVPKPVVVVDTREQHAFGYSFERFSKWFDGVERAKLSVGDYSIQGLEGNLAIERKSLPDLVNSVIQNRKGFLSQCRRLATLGRKAIVIEASLAKVKSTYPESQAHPNAVVGSLLAAQERWGIQILWCDNAELAEEAVAHILSKYYTLHWLKKNRRRQCFVDGDV